MKYEAKGAYTIRLRAPSSWEWMGMTAHAKPKG